MRATRAQWSAGAAGPVLAAAEPPRSARRLRLAGDARPACSGADPELFFPDNPAGADPAKAICATCPLRASCLAGAVARGDSWGVWGGEYFARGVICVDRRLRENAHLRVARPPGAPRTPAFVSLVCNNGHRRSTANTREGAEGQTRCLDCERDRLVRSRARKAAA